MLNVSQPVYCEIQPDIKASIDRLNASCNEHMNRQPRQPMVTNIFGTPAVQWVQAHTNAPFTRHARKSRTSKVAGVRQRPHLQRVQVHTNAPFTRHARMSCTSKVAGVHQRPHYKARMKETHLRRVQVHTNAPITWHARMRRSRKGCRCAPTPPLQGTLE